MRVRVRVRVRVRMRMRMRVCIQQELSGWPISLEMFETRMDDG